MSLAGLTATARRAFAVLAIAYLATASFPAAYYPVHPGLDVSWVYGLNELVSSPFRFGRDVNFTCGPLGFLLYPANLGHNVLLTIVFRTVTAAFFVLALGLLAPGRFVGLVLFAVAYGAALGIGLPFELHLLVVVAIAMVAAIERRSFPGLLAVAAISGPLWLMKFSVGIGAATVVFAAACAWHFFRGGKRSSTVAILLAHAASLLCVGWLEIGSLTDFWLWLRTSFEMASGYSTGMSLDPGWTDQKKGVAICALYLGAFAVLYRIRRSAALPLALLAGSMFLAFKAGFVREDAHVKNFFGLAGAALAVPLLTASSAKERIVSGLAVLMTLGLGVRAELKRNYLDATSFSEIATGKLGFVGIGRALHRRDTELWLDRVTAQGISDARLPDEMRRAIGTGTIAVMPWELVTCLANDLACVPLRTLQAYAAYTPYLDSIAAAQFADGRGPDFVLLHGVGGIDGRHLILDGPLLWRNLLDHYEPVRLEPRRLVLLRRRGFPARVDTVPLSSEQIQPGEWVGVPRTPGFIFAEMRFELTWLGRLVKLLHRIPAGFIELKHGSGATERHRLNFETSTNGLLVQPFAANIESLPTLFRGADGDRVVALRITGRATRYYGEEISVQWLARSVRSDGPASGP